jgi:hypothetical protein
MYKNKIFSLVLIFLSIKQTSQELSCTDLNDRIKEIRDAKSKLGGMLQLVKNTCQKDKNCLKTIDFDLIQKNSTEIENLVKASSLSEKSCNKINLLFKNLYQQLTQWGNLRYKNQTNLTTQKEKIYNSCLDTSRYFAFINGKSQNSDQQKKKEKENLRNKLIENTTNQNSPQDNLPKLIENTTEDLHKVNVDIVEEPKKNVKVIKRRIYVIEKLACKNCQQDEYLKNLFK